MEWVPTGFKVGLNEVPAAQLGEKDETALFERNVVMIGKGISARMDQIERFREASFRVAGVEAQPRRKPTRIIAERKREDEVHPAELAFSRET